MSTFKKFTMRSRFGWLLQVSILGVIAALAFGLTPSSAVDDVKPVPPELGGPPSPAVGAGVPESYFGPMASEVDKNLVGPVQLLRSGPMGDDGQSITLPLYKGQMADGRSVWYILTDTTDKENAEGLGLNFASKLAFADVGQAARTGRLEADTSLTFDQGTVDFGPERQVVAGSPVAFPPEVAEPGSVGAAEYSPLVRIENQPGTPIYNAPVIAFDATAEQLAFCDGEVDHSLLHDRVLKICPDSDNGGGTVTIALTPIFSFAKPSVYMSTEASDAVTAALDMGTFAPALGDIATGRDDSAFSAIERLFVTANGPTGADNPQRQGLESTLVDNLPPLHVVGGLPTVALDYSPLWDLNLGEWTAEAIERGYRSRLIDEFQLLNFVRDGWITGPGGAPYGSTGIVVNCPIVARSL
ncbi:MAG: hypothetical protein M3R01_04640 [Actinomycetota bacterium]|nr:hypothetical protein [Actinomycetota bacterium]